MFICYKPSMYATDYNQQQGNENVLLSLSLHLSHFLLLTLCGVFSSKSIAILWNYTAFSVANDKRSRCHAWHLILDKLLIISEIFSHRKLRLRTHSHSSVCFVHIVCLFARSFVFCSVCAQCLRMRV